MKIQDNNNNKTKMMKIFKKYQQDYFLKNKLVLQETINLYKYQKLLQIKYF